MTNSAYGLVHSPDASLEKITRSISTEPSCTTADRSRLLLPCNTPSIASTVSCTAPFLARQRLVPCRRCSQCIYARRNHWVYRMMHEYSKWPRSWMVTLTARRAEYFTYHDIQKWLKRVRSNSSCSLKYVCTEEFGSINGRRHFHLIIFADANLKQRHLRGTYIAGISEAKLITSTPGRAMRYVAKYILKENSRVYASNSIGKVRKT